MTDKSYIKKLTAPDVTDIVNRNRSIIEICCELVDEALLRYNIEVINNDERIEENSFLNNDVLDENNIENGDVSSMDQGGIVDFEITSPFLLQNDEEIIQTQGSESI